MNATSEAKSRMVVILVHWLIRHGSEKKFTEVWRNMTINKGHGLYREMLTQPVDHPDPKFTTFSITDKNYTTFINIGFWRSLDDFNAAVGMYIPPATEALDPVSGRIRRTVTLEEFEFKIRE